MSSLLLQPLDVVKTWQQQKQNRSAPKYADLSRLFAFRPLAAQSVTKYRDIFSVIRSIVREGGVLSLWRGFTPTLIRVLPGSGLCPLTPTEIFFPSI
jgi:hypothetical protein